MGTHLAFYTVKLFYIHIKLNSLQREMFYYLVINELIDYS